MSALITLFIDDLNSRVSFGNIKCNFSCIIWTAIDHYDSLPITNCLTLKAPNTFRKILGIVIRWYND